MVDHALQYLETDTFMHVDGLPEDHEASRPVTSRRAWGEGWGSAGHRDRRLVSQLTLPPMSSGAGKIITAASHLCDRRRERYLDRES